MGNEKDSISQLKINQLLNELYQFGITKFSENRE